MKKVLIMDTGSFKVFGGAATTAYDTYAYLKKLGYNAELFGDFSRIDKKAKTVTEEELSSKKYDAVLLNSIRDVPVVNRLIRPNNKSARYIYTDRGNVLHNFEISGFKRLLPKMIARQMLMMQMRNWLNCYVALTAEQLEHSKEFFKPETKKKFIPNWFSPSFKRLPIKKGSFALYVGRLDERQKRVSFLINGIAKAAEKKLGTKKEVLLQIVGDGPDIDFYKGLTRKLNLNDRIVFHGFIDSRGLLRMYNSAAFFVSTSDWEGMSGTFVEALACGLPLLINEKNNTMIHQKPREMLVEDTYNGLVYKHGDLKSFAEKFSKLYTDAGLRKRLSENSFKSSKRFEMKRNLDEYVKLIES
jgi:glycosyltransferase involved in cell wall biosynthesis